MKNNPHHSFRQAGRSAGFSLIELMIAVAIMSILAAIVIPAYRNYTITGKLPLATAGLASEQVQMEQFFQDNQTYQIPSTPPTPNPCTSGGTASATPYFTFSCTTNTATTYVLDAKGVAGSATAGFEYTLDNNGTRQTLYVGNTHFGTGSPVSATCWVIRTGGQC
jgi:type IV pilus assembly protein PilE